MWIYANIFCLAAQTRLIWAQSRSSLETVSCLPDISTISIVLSRAFVLTPPAFPNPSYASHVKPVLGTLSTKGPRQNLQKFTSFKTRCTCWLEL